MIKVEIKNLQSFITNARQFETRQLAEAWVSEHSLALHFGKIAGEYPQSQLSQDEISQATNTRTTDESGRTLVEPVLTIPAQFTIEYTDISAQIIQDKLNVDSLAYLASTDWLVLRAIDDATKPVPEDIKQKRAAARAAIVR
jgi:hypothetical protein